MNKHGQEVCDPEPYPDRNTWKECTLSAIRACREFLSKWYSLGLTDRYSLSYDGLKGEFRSSVDQVFSVLEHPLAQEIPNRDAVERLCEMCYDWGHRSNDSYAKPPMPGADETQQLDDLLRVVEGELTKQADSEPDLPDLITGNQLGGLLGLSRRSISRYVKKGLLPPPDITTADGKAHKWNWPTVRPAAEELLGRSLPAQFPASRIMPTFEP